MSVGFGIVTFRLFTDRTRTGSKNGCCRAQESASADLFVLSAMPLFLANHWLRSTCGRQGRAGRPRAERRSVLEVIGFAHVCLQELKITFQSGETILFPNGRVVAGDLVLEVQRDGTMKAATCQRFEEVLPVHHAFT